MRFSCSEVSVWRFLKRYSIDESLEVLNTPQDGYSQDSSGASAITSAIASIAADRAPPLIHF